MQPITPQYHADKMSTGDVQRYLLETLATSVGCSLRIDYDLAYGSDRRSGWSVSYDGSVIVQFAPTYVEALSLALAVRARAMHAEDQDEDT